MKIVYDDNCDFCCWCIQRFGLSDDWTFIGFSELDEIDKEQLPSNYKESLHVIKQDGTVLSNGEAAELLLKNATHIPDTLFNQINRSILYRKSRNSAYNIISSNRSIFSNIIRDGICEELSKKN